MHEAADEGLRVIILEANSVAKRVKTTRVMSAASPIFNC